MQTVEISWEKLEQLSDLDVLDYEQLSSKQAGWEDATLHAIERLIKPRNLEVIVFETGDSEIAFTIVPKQPSNAGVWTVRETENSDDSRAIVSLPRCLVPSAKEMAALAVHLFEDPDGWGYYNPTYPEDEPHGSYEPWSVWVEDPDGNLTHWRCFQKKPDYPLEAMKLEMDHPDDAPTTDAWVHVEQIQPQAKAKVS